MQRPVASCRSEATVTPAACPERQKTGGLRTVCRRAVYPSLHRTCTSAHVTLLWTLTNDTERKALTEHVVDEAVHLLGPRHNGLHVFVGRVAGVDGLCEELRRRRNGVQRVSAAAIATHTETKKNLRIKLTRADAMASHITRTATRGRRSPGFFHGQAAALPQPCAWCVPCKWRWRKWRVRGRTWPTRQSQ